MEFVDRVEFRQRADQLASALAVQAFHSAIAGERLQESGDSPRMHGCMFRHGGGCSGSVSGHQQMDGTSGTAEHRVIRLVSRIYRRAMGLALGRKSGKAAMDRERIQPGLNTEEALAAKDDGTGLPDWGRESDGVVCLVKID